MVVKYSLNFPMRFQLPFFRSFSPFLKCKKSFGSTSLHCPHLAAYPTWPAKLSLLISALLEIGKTAKLYFCLRTYKRNSDLLHLFPSWSTVQQACFHPVFFWSKAHTKMRMCLQRREKIIPIKWCDWLLACGWCWGNASKINCWNVTRKATVMA